MIPVTDAYQAPRDAPNPYGRGMHHTVLYRRLKGIVPNLWMPMPEHYAGWFPGKESGVTCMWLGMPSTPGSKKLCAITLGAIPEFTIKDKAGNLKQKGWRAIFARLIRAKACTKQDLERAFLINLDKGKKGDGLCTHCARAGKSVKSDGGALGLCKLHNNIQAICRRARERKKEEKWLSTLSPDKRLLHQNALAGISSHVTLDLASSPPKAISSREARPRARKSPSTSKTASTDTRSSSLVSATSARSSTSA